MKVRFKRMVTVEFEDARSGEIFDKTFDRNQTIEIGGTELNVRNFVNLHFLNGDLAISVPKDSFDVI